MTTVAFFPERHGYDGPVFGRGRAGEGRGRRVAGALVAFLVPLTACSLIDDTKAERTTASSSQPQLWSVANEGGRAFQRRDGRRDAATFDIITAQPGAYDGQTAQMREVNARSRVLGYVNGALAPPQQAEQLPEAWHARDAAGATISSVSYGNVLMDPRHPGWITDRADACRRLVEVSAYDGCMLDVLGVAPVQPGYVTSPPVDPRTGRPFTESAWLAATSALAAGVKSEVGDNVLVVANGLDRAQRYFSEQAPSSVLLDGVDGGVAEGWLRRAEAPLDARPSEEEWLREVEMLEDAASRGKLVLVLPKAWTPGSEARKGELHELALATFLLGTSDTTYFAFSYGPQQDPTRVRPLDELDLGPPTADRTVDGAVHVRRFERGVALVNPTDRPQTVDIGNGFVGVDGAAGTSLRLPPYSGKVLQRATSDQ